MRIKVRASTSFSFVVSPLLSSPLLVSSLLFSSRLFSSLLFFSLPLLFSSSSCSGFGAAGVGRVLWKGNVSLLLQASQQWGVWQCQVSPQGDFDAQPQLQREGNEKACPNDGSRAPLE